MSEMKIAIVVLLLLLSLCQGMEYYVRPTDRELANASCAGQPCLTLSQYVGGFNIYFKSNTVFRFLPGIHHANEMLKMENLENVTLEGEKHGEFTMVIMDIYCSNHDCAGFCFLNISKLSIQSLSFSIHAQTLPFFSPSNEQLLL